MMILTKPTEAEAQELADRCHSWLIANDPAYAASVAAGQTTAWAIPAQDEESGLWQVPVSERVRGALTSEERVAAGLVVAEQIREVLAGDVDASWAESLTFP